MAIIMANKTKVRDSNFELLRVLLIFMVLLGHANMWFLGSEYQTETEHCIRVFVEVVCLPAVNAFVLISGWFGIKGDYRRVFPIIFQLLMCTVPVAIVMNAMRQINLLNLDDIAEYVLGGNNYWFVIDYIGLVLFAPILNIIVHNVNKVVLRTFFIGVLALIVPLDVVFRSSVLGVNGGYSLIWFIYLYLLARYMRLYGIEWLDRSKWMVMVACIVLQTILLYFNLIGNRYTNPLILLPAMSIILIFKEYSFKSNIVNYLASGTLIVYMLHMHPCFYREIGVFLRNLYYSNGYYWYMIDVIGLIVLLYFVAVAVDKMQALIWRSISRLIFDNK